MEFLVVVCHPDTRSLNHAIAARAETAIRDAGATPVTIDLYAESFDPLLTAEEMARRFTFDENAQRHARLVAESDGYVIVHPDWWGMPPALLKGWLDRVFRPGIVYDFDGPEFVAKQKTPLLRGRRALVFVTSDVEDGSEDERSRTGLLTSIWRDAVFGFCGVDDAHVRVFCGVHGSSMVTRRRWLEEVGTSTLSWVSNAPSTR